MESRGSIQFHVAGPDEGTMTMEFFSEDGRVVAELRLDPVEDMHSIINIVGHDDLVRMANVLDELLGLT